MVSDAVDGRTAKRDLKSDIGNLKRESILEAAADLFSQRGYHNVSVEAVAESLGVTKPFVYYTFRDKNDILLAICRRAAELTLSAVKAVEGLPGTPLNRLAAFCASFVNCVIDNRKFIAIYTRDEVSLTIQQQKEVAQIRIEIDRCVTRILEAAISAGEVGGGVDPVVTATAITAMISSLWFWYREKGAAARSRLVQTIVEISMRMAGAPTIS